MAMSSIEFDYEWIDPAGAKGSELRATWAQFGIKVDGQPITRLMDGLNKCVRTNIFLPLYPLAEWFATHWWFLLYEFETPGHSDEDDYDSRHSIRFGAEGFALPGLSIRPLGDTIKLNWRPVRLDSQNIEFPNEGYAFVDSGEFREKLHDFLAAIDKRMQDQGVHKTLFQEEWHAISEINPEEKDFCIAAASLGKDPFDISKKLSEDIINISEQLPESLIQAFFNVADWAALKEQASQINHAVNCIKSNSVDLVSLRRLRENVHIKKLVNCLNHTSPWDQGYNFAGQLRTLLDLGQRHFKSFEDLGNVLEVQPDELDEVIITDCIEQDEQIPVFDALVNINEHNSPGFAIPDRREQARKFAFCRGLFEFLIETEFKPLLVTKARSNQQKRNRAFAAEFLAPADSLRGYIKGRNVVGEEEIDYLAETFGVSHYVIRHQIENHRLARVLSME